MLNKAIKDRRLELGLTLKEVADKLGVAESTVLRYESADIKNMGIDKLENLASVLQCTPEDLMGCNIQTSNSEIDIRLKQYIKDQYGSLSAFSKVIGMPLTTLDSILKRGVFNSNFSNIIKIMDALNLSTDALAEGRLENKE